MQKLYQQCEVCEAHMDSVLLTALQSKWIEFLLQKPVAIIKKGQHIFYVDNIPLGVYCICKGIVKLVKTNNDGKEQILRFAQSGEFLGYRALIADEPLVSTAICLEDTIACFFPRKTF